MYARSTVLLLLVSNVFATYNSGVQDLQTLLNRLGINTTETSCMVPNFSLDLFSLLRLANGQQQLDTTWLDALQFCRIFGMDLATVETSEENTLLRGHLAGLGLTNQYVAISGNKIGRGTYYWANGATVNFQDWGPGEPAQFSTENCMIMWNGHWADIPCEAYTGYFICEQIP